MYNSDIQTIEHDVLVVGAGGAGIRAAIECAGKGLSTGIISKSLLGKARSRPDLVRKVISTARKQGVLNTFKKVQSKLDPPIPLGYSSAGIVVAPTSHSVPSITGAALGRCI